MEVTLTETQTETLPPLEHPNYRLWANYAKFARDRGALVARIVANEIEIDGAQILDIGFGAGGTSLVLAEKGSHVTAIDFNSARVQNFNKIASESGLSIMVEKGIAQELNFDDSQFDCVILQDVIEHLGKPQVAVKEIARVLKKGGIVYLSTPNRWSPLNFISDPHWNLPLVSILPRKLVGLFIVKLIRREKEYREDFAELLSLRRLKQLFIENQFDLKMTNSIVAKAIFENPTSVVNSDFHIKIINWMKKIKLDKVVQKIVDDKFGLFNYFINPTWYFVAKKL